MILPLLALALLLTMDAQARVQTLPSIEHAVVRFISSQKKDDSTIDVAVQRLDQRLKLAECEQDLDVQWSSARKTVGRVTVAVSCEQPRPWLVRVQATVTQHISVWVLSRSVRKGDALDETTVSKQEITLGKGGHQQLPAGVPIRELQPWQGYVFARAVGQGHLLTDRMLAQPDLISRGDPVSITVSRGKLSIQARGIALGSAALNQRISVRNKNSGKVVQAIVASRTSVVLPQ